MNIICCCDKFEREYLKAWHKWIQNSKQGEANIQTWLYLASRSPRQGAPALIWPVARPTDKSAMKVSSVSPLLWDITTPQLASLAIFTTSIASVTVPIWLTCIPAHPCYKRWGKKTSPISLSHMWLCSIVPWRHKYVNCYLLLEIQTSISRYLEKKGITRILLNGSLDSFRIRH